MKQFSKSLLAVAIMLISGFALAACGTDPMDAKLTEENYNAVVVDTTTYQDAVELFGEPQDDQALTDGAGTITWSNDNETLSVTLTFDNSIVTAKTQEGIL